MLPFFVNKKCYLVPEKWNELSGRQLLAAIKVLYGNYEVAEARVRLFKIITGITWFKLWRRGTLWLEQYLYLADWLVQGNALTAQLLPKYKNFYGPAGDFDNLTGAEFTFAENYYLRFRANEQDMEALNYLSATLYRPAKTGYNKKLNPAGDFRETFNANLLDHYANVVAKWPLHVRMALLTWYDGCRTQLTIQYKDVFKGTGETAQFGFWSVMRGIAEKGTHGTFESVERMNIKIMMMELTSLIKEGERLDELYDKKTRT